MQWKSTWAELNKIWYKQIHLSQKPLTNKRNDPIEQVKKYNLDTFHCRSVGESIRWLVGVDGIEWMEWAVGWWSGDGKGGWKEKLIYVAVLKRGVKNQIRYQRWLIFEFLKPKKYHSNKKDTHFSINCVNSYCNFN